MITFLPSRAIAVDLFGFQVHWYGIMYLLGFVLAAVILPYVQKYRKLYLTRDEWMSILSFVIIGVIVGGRLGYVLFYNPEYYAANPMKIFAVWEGGMSAHGGFIGVTLMLFLAVRKYHLPFFRVADVATVPAALGLVFGRIGNFINQELYGTVTSLPWGISIPGVEGLRHPTPIYEALYSLVIAGLCYLYLRYVRPVVPGRTMALFFILYGIFRFLTEYVREQEYPLTNLGFMEVTRGQLLNIPIFLFGLLLWLWLRKNEDQEG